ncbi:MAG TPA: hypothetical protein VKA46_14345, partial [Gemmataceae bacterium]|nr:hypothetical protein [Gemmataceae bacterium]
MISLTGRSVEQRPVSITHGTKTSASAVVSTALSIAHWAEESDALPIIRVALPIVPFASCLLQEPITYATMHLRQ